MEGHYSKGTGAGSQAPGLAAFRLKSRRANRVNQLGISRALSTLVTYTLVTM